MPGQPAATAGRPVAKPSPADSSLTSAEVQRLRETLKRAVGRSCPRWLAEDREDIVQNAILRVIRAFDKTEEVAPRTASYLWRAAHSAVMDEIARRRRGREVAVEARDLDRTPATGSGPDRLQASAELREAIAAGMRSLKEPRRWAVALYMRGFSLQESARILGWKTKRVDNQRYQGLAELRAYLRRRGFEP